MLSSSKHEDATLVHMNSASPHVEATLLHMDVALPHLDEALAPVNAGLRCLGTASCAHGRWAHTDAALALLDAVVAFKVGSTNGRLQGR